MFVAEVGKAFFYYEVWIFYVKVSIKHKKTKPKESMPLSSVLSSSKHNFFESYYVSTLHKKMKFSIKDFISNCDQIRRKLRIRSHLLKKSLKENFIFCAELRKFTLMYYQSLATLSNNYFQIWKLEKGKLNDSHLYTSFFEKAIVTFILAHLFSDKFYF